MKRGDCKFHGNHKTRLVLVEECPDCGHRRQGKAISRFGVTLVGPALWFNALLLGLLVFK